MTKGIPQNIIELSYNNLNVLKMYGVRREELVGNLSMSLRVGWKYLIDAFLEYGIDNEFKTEMGIETTTWDTINDILKFDPGLIIVRPEMFHVTENICDFLEKRNFKVIFLSEKKITAEEYFFLYSREIVHNAQNFRLALPSRTLAYTNAKSSIIVFTRANNFGGEHDHLADSFFEKYKGWEGNKSENTIRGDIIHKEALRLGFDTLKNSEIAIAIDPFATYSELVKEKVGDFYHLKTSFEFYMFMYTAQGVHCPNYEELPRNLATIFSLNNLVELKDTLEK